MEMGCYRFYKGLQTLIVVILTFIISLLFSWLMAYLPKGDYIIGYKIKR